MKRILMIALMAFPVTFFGQAELSRMDAAGNKTRPARPNTESVEAIYVEVIVSFNEKEGQIVRTEFGSDGIENIGDKETVVQMKELSSKIFKTVPDAMKELASMNFKFLTTYEIPGKDGRPAAHLVFEKRVLGRAVREEMEKQSAKPATPAPATKTK